MSRMTTLETKAIQIATRYFPWCARIAFFIIFFLFGFLKIVGASPANELALGFAEHMGAGAIAQELYLALAFVECVIGILFLVPKLTSLATKVMLAHMVLVSAPIILYPQAVWQAPFVPNLEGQYIIKNLALVALALGLLSATGSADSQKKKK